MEKRNHFQMAEKLAENSDKGLPNSNYIPALNDRQKTFLKILTIPLSVLGANSIYLVCIPVQAQNPFYFWMFLLHLVLGFGLIFPFLLFATGHLLRSYRRTNRKAVKGGLILYAISIAIILTGLVLCQRRWSHDFILWAHRILPLVAIVAYLFHRLAGPEIQWKWGAVWSVIVISFVLVMAIMHNQDPRKWFVKGGGEQYFFPSAARTTTGGFIPGKVLSNSNYCQECHQDAHESWLTSAHRFSSFNNLPYRMTVLDLKDALNERDGNTQAARWCAGCHDPVPFFSGAFDDPNFDDETGSSQAGLTCTSCHAISNINTITGNADYTIEEPLHYPFAFSHNKFLKWVNRSLIKAKPAFHKRTFLKPFHRTSEFCSVCHKVSLIPELNHYKWLRGQNHYDSWQESGISGHGVSSFYYPKKSKKCSDCHMPLTKSQDFGNLNGTIHDHTFTAANTGLLAINEKLARENGDGVMAEKFRKSLEKTKDFLQDQKLRVDILGLRKSGEITGEFLGPIRPVFPKLNPGEEYLLEIVVRNLGVGHEFTQGTVDSNQVWIELELSAGNQRVGHSGKMDEEGFVDPSAHFLNALVLDRNGRRIDRRNAQDIFVSLYNHGIPPGAGHVVHYRFRVPEGLRDPLRFQVRVLYRKFDQTYMNFVFGKGKAPKIPKVVMAEDQVTLPVMGIMKDLSIQKSDVPTYLRMNDYGIGLLLPPKNGIQRPQTRLAEYAFKKVIQLKPDYIDGYINLARVYIADGRLDEARQFLQTAYDMMIESRKKTGEEQDWWKILWWGGLVNRASAMLEEAAKNFEEILNTKIPERGFDFSKDRNVLNELGITYFQLAIRYGDQPNQERDYFDKSIRAFKTVLEIDPENLKAHKQLKVVYAWIGDEEKSKIHRNLHLKYKKDDQAIEQAWSAYQAKNPLAKRYNQLIVIYDLEN